MANGQNDIPFYNDLNPYWDKNIFIKPNLSCTDSGNGILYTAVMIILGNALYAKQDFGLQYTIQVEKCLKDGGLLTRTPDNSYGLETFDDYLGLSAACIVLKNKSIPRNILWYGIKHFGYRNNTPKFTWNAFLFRTPAPWVLMWIAAFPWLKYPLYPILKLISHFNVPSVTDGSGIQLSFVFEEACRVIGFRNSLYSVLKECLPFAFTQYYDKAHPFIAAAGALQESNL